MVHFMTQNQPGLLINNGKYNHTMYYISFVLYVTDAEMIYTSFLYDAFTKKYYTRVQSVYTDHVWTLNPDILQ